jgi:hypothetical protein
MTRVPRTSRDAGSPGPFALAARALFVVVCAVLLPCSLCACTCGKGGGPPPEAGRDFGETGPSVDATPYLALARGVLEQHPASPPAPPAPGRRVFLTWWPARPPSGEPLVSTANAPTLAGAVEAAARVIASKGVDPAHGRLELDVTTDVSGASLDDDTPVPLALVGLEGIFVTRDDGKSGFVLPGEIVQLGMFHAGNQPKFDQEKIDRVLAQRAGVTEVDHRSMRAYRFRADARVESPGRDGALPVLRGMVEHPPQATPALLLEGVRRGADYLSRALNAEGRYQYMYHPVDERDDRSYGWLRHAGATYALLEAYEELGTPLYLAKAELALAYATQHLHVDPGGQGKYLLDTNDEEQQKVGGAGLALIAFAKDASVTGRLTEIETMRSLGRLIIDQQYGDGHFRENADLEVPQGGTKRKREPVYYVGEAILGLMRLYAIDPKPMYLEAARKGADFVAHVRDAAASEDDQEHDHWISYAYNELYRVVPDPTYLAHAYKIARAIEKKRLPAAGAQAPDFASTFYEGQSTPASTRVEAYAADIALSRFAGRPDGWLLDPAREVAAWILGQQFDPANAYWLADPAKADGAVRESLFVQDVRIDYVQHAMSAWLHLARSLRDPEYGKTGVPSQDPPLRRPGPGVSAAAPAAAPAAPAMSH